MQGLTNLVLKRDYDSDDESILQDFYIPALVQSITYYRLAGYFTSSNLAVAAFGIRGLIENGGNIKLVVSPQLTKEDIQVILETKIEPEKYLSKHFQHDLDNIEKSIIRDHVSALGWLIGNDRLEIKVAIPPIDINFSADQYRHIQKGIFYQKAGILRDSNGDSISFSRSINETFKEWKGNIEEFKTFRGWIDGESEYMKDDQRKFNKFWKNEARNIKVIDIPDASKETS